MVPEKEEKKQSEKIFEETVARNIPNKGNGQSSPRITESPIQVKLKEKHAKTHIIKPTKIKHKETALCYRKTIKNSKGKATSNIQGKSHMINR